MTLSEKITALRKKQGWSQEELGARVSVSRQAVSKWESGQATPDIENILQMARLFGVSTDYLLKDDEEACAEMPAQVSAEPEIPRVTMEEAENFLAVQKGNAKRIALATAMCILSPIPMLASLALANVKEVVEPGVAQTARPMPAVGLGLIVLLLTVAAAVVLFVTAGQRSAPYRYITEGRILPDADVREAMQARRAAAESRYSRWLICGIVLCILSVAVLLYTVFFHIRYVMVGVCLLLAIVAAGVYLIVAASVPVGALDALLEQGDYTPEAKARAPFVSAVSSCYWMVALAVYLVYSFAADAWDVSWIVWAAAGILYTPVLLLARLIGKK